MRTRTDMKYLTLLRDNAMFYKDLTQWMRNQTFVGLFALLLCLSWAACAFITFLPIEAGNGGPILFALLSGGLGLFTFVIAIQGFLLTSREFSSRTFELYELSGMSLEMMILGKLWSLLAQFLFGFFCVVPFMFFAFLLGGVDFYDVIASALSALVFALPLFLVSLVIAMSTRTRAIGMAGRIVLILVAIYVIPNLIFGVFGMFLMGGRGGFSIAGPGQLITRLFAGDPGAWKTLGIGLVFYSQVCLLLFYSACHVLAPSTDTRELPIKLLCTSLAASWIFAWGNAYLGALNTEYLYPLAFGLYFLMLVLGAAWYYHRLNPPPMAADRRAAARGGVRWAHYFFAPGAYGTMRTLLLLWIVCAVFLMLASLSGATGGTPYGATSSDAFRILSYPLQVPYFLVVPAALFQLAPVFRRNPKKLRTLVILLWVAAGAALSIAYGIFSTDSSLHPLAELAQAVGAFASPLSGAVVGHNKSSGLYDALPVLRVVLGLVAFGALWGMLRHRKTEAENGRIQEELRRRAAAAPAEPALLAEPLASVEKAD